MASESKRKKVQVLSPSYGTNNEEVDIRDEEEDIDWGLCFICQSSKNSSTLQCPLNNAVGSKATNTDSIKRAYSNLANNIVELLDIDECPVKLHPHVLSNTSDLGRYLFDNKAKYHKNCKKVFDNDKIARAKERYKKKSIEHEASPDSSSTLNLRSSREKDRPAVCFFCNEPKGENRPLRLAMTFSLDARVRQAAIDSNNVILYAKLQNGDMCAQDAVYHADCLCKLYREAQRQRLGDVSDHKSQQLHGLAFSKVISFIDEVVQTTEDDNIPLFKLADLSKYYTQILESYGITDYQEHNTRFKKRIMACYDDMYEEPDIHGRGRGVLLGFRKDLADIISSVRNIDYDNEGSILAQASQIIRRDLFKMERTTFDGSFKPGFQEESIPDSLKCLLSEMMHGNNTTNPHYQQAVLTIGQLIRFNTLKRFRKESTSMFHSQEREPPVAIFISELIHSRTRDMSIVDDFARLGLGVSKERVLQLSTAMGNAVIEGFGREGVVAPRSLEKGHFCTAAIDNIDVDPQSSYSKTSLHGTAASINVHRGLDVGIPRETVPIDFLKRTLQKLPDEYTEITPLHLPPATPPTVEKVGLRDCPPEEDLKKDLEWLESKDLISFSAFHSRKEETPRKFKEDDSALLPIWRDDSKSPATICHGIRTVKKAIGFLNPDQTPVCTLDQPLYAISKNLQWYLPKEFGSSQLVLILGSLHVEMAMLSTIGDWLDGSGWLELIAKAGVTGPGNNYLLNGKKVATTKYVHQVTATVLHRLMRHVYDLTENLKENKKDFDTWRKEMEGENPLFQYWSIALKLEMAYFQFIRSLRSRNFTLYRHSIHQLLVFLFALDHYLYARWLSVHAFDMDNLSLTDADVYLEFEENGNFVIARTLNKFSSMGIDQRHEQLNAEVKGDGGAVGLTEDEDKLLRWMVCGPEEARLVREFRKLTLLSNENEDSYHNHHEDSASFQEMFAKDVQNLEKEFLANGNPFEPGCTELLNIVTNDVMDDDVVNSVRTMESLGNEQKTAFFNMLVNDPDSFNNPVKKNKLPLMNCSHNNKNNKTGMSKTQQTKEHLHLFSELYVTAQVRGGNMDEFFQYETLSYPPAISEGGNLRTGDKSQLTTHLLGLVRIPTDVEPLSGTPVVDAVVIDGPVVVHQIKPVKNRTVDHYVEELIYPHLVRYKACSKAERMDVIYDTYPSTSLKQTTRNKRGSGSRRKVASGTLVPSNWKQFLRSSENKVELFRYLSTAISDLSEGSIICAYDDTTTAGTENSSLAPTDHEEADTRIFLHIKEISRTGLKDIMIRTVDTDLIIIAISLYHSLDVSQLWIDFGSGKNRGFIPIHDIAFDPVKRMGLRFFFAFTGCDQVSFFAHITKKTAWKMWQVFPEVNESFAKLSNEPTEETLRESLPVIERFVILMYNRTSNCTSINECRKDLFCKGRTIDKIPPTQAALFQQMKRASFVAGFVWKRSLIPMMNLPSFECFGFDEHGLPYWTDLPAASRAVRELKKCTCKTGCVKKCGCKPLHCTELCACRGSCGNAK